VNTPLPNTGSTASSGAFSDSVLESVQVDLEAFVGQAELTIGQMKRLKRGDTIALTAKLNEVIELRLNGKAIARGEVVAVGDNFGIRLTEIVP
jgi:flagellar motor switch protein FliN/FliY